MTRSTWRPRRSFAAGGLPFRLAALLLAAGLLGAQQPGPTPAPDPAVAPSSGTPRLFVEKNDHNYGRVLKGELVEHEFIVRNDGDGPLLIKNVQAT